MKAPTPAPAGTPKLHDPRHSLVITGLILLEASLCHNTSRGALVYCQSHKCSACPKSTGTKCKITPPPTFFRPVTPFGEAVPLSDVKSSSSVTSWEEQKAVREHWPRSAPSTHQFCVSKHGHTCTGPGKCMVKGPGLRILTRSAKPRGRRKNVLVFFRGSLCLP